MNTYCFYFGQKNGLYIGIITGFCENRVLTEFKEM